MFREATARARMFTRPVVVSFREPDGRVGTSVGTYVVVNDAGWVVTTAHVLDVAGQAAPGRVTAASHWWSRDGVRLVDAHVLPELDLAVSTWSHSRRDWLDGYPVFKEPTTGIEPGVSLCRMGFPFPNVTSTYDPDSGHFRMIDPQLVFFPNEGIVAPGSSIPGARPTAHTPS